MIDISKIDAKTPVLIAGPTASGKSELALQIAQAAGGIIVNADASQVFDGWRVVTARPSAQDEARAPHALYGHVPFEAGYSAGDWLRDAAPLLDGPNRPIIVGGTGLYFMALTEGLAQIPPTAPQIRAQADALRSTGRTAEMIAGLDPVTAARVDLQNPMRVQRAWEVQQSTGRGLAAWQDETPPPLLPLDACLPILVEADTEWLNDRIARRFDLMLRSGALEEAQANLHRYNPEFLSCKAIGVPEMTAFAQGAMDLEQARLAATIATRQYAKRQRTWFRKRMRAWTKLCRPTD